MRLQMIGIDHRTAPVQVRERYAFTRASARAALQDLKKTEGVAGCVMISTCNRLELYVSLSAEEGPDLYALVCGWKGYAAGAERAYFREKKDMEAARHLFELSCGLRSQILGEDQILTQVKDALSLAREEFATDNCMEVLFRRAVTVAKKVKSSVALEKGNRSAATAAVMHLQNEGVSFAGKRVLVIGNGMMGRLTAQALMEEQARVTVTVRQYRSGVVDIPQGAARINYGERYELLPSCDCIFSATASPNLTITPEGLRGIDLTGKVFVDLAVPRDIDPAVGTLPGVRLLGMDDLAAEQLSPAQEKQQEEAQRHIGEALAQFERFFSGRDLIPRIGKISEDAGADLWGRMRADCAALGETQRRRVETAAKRDGGKVVAHVLYALRDGLDGDTFAQCLRILEGK